jgi:group I intron endonuclease
MLIYLARNSVNGKVYIGQTIRSLEERKSDHLRQAIKQSRRSHFHAAIRKYGFEVFEWEILERILVREALSPAECYWIHKYKSTNPRKGYNNTTGGEHYEHTEQARRNISLAGKGRKLSTGQIDGIRIRMRSPDNPWRGRHHTAESNAKNRAAHVGKKLTPEHIAKCVHMGEANPRASLTTAKVIGIKTMLRDGMRNVDIQCTLGVTKGALQGVKHGVTWRHVQI